MPMVLAAGIDPVHFGLVVTLKLKQANFQTLSRRQSLRDATQMADTIYRCARGLFDAVGDKGPYRLIGCGLSHLVPAAEADRSADLLDPNAARRAGADHKDSAGWGISLDAPPPA